VVPQIWDTVWASKRHKEITEGKIVLRHQKEHKWFKKSYFESFVNDIATRKISF